MLIPLRFMVAADLVEDENTKYTTDKILQITYQDPNVSNKQE